MTARASNFLSTYNYVYWPAYMTWCSIFVECGKVARVATNSACTSSCTIVEYEYNHD